MNGEIIHVIGPDALLGGRLCMRINLLTPSTSGFLNLKILEPCRTWVVCYNTVFKRVRSDTFDSPGLTYPNVAALSSS